jgi:hypothetical protein
MLAAPPMVKDLPNHALGDGLLYELYCDPLVVIEVVLATHWFAN